MALSKTDVAAVEIPDRGPINGDGNGDGEPVGPGTYTGANIRVLEGIEAVRLRPSMYIGDTTVRGLHHLVYEVVDNSIDEAMAGHCRNIHVTIHADGSASIVDDGRGIPVDVHPESGLNTLEVVLTKVHAGGKFDHDTYKVSGGLHGVGVTVVNALSEWLEAEVRREGQVWRQDFRQGVADGPVRATGAAKTTGTKIRFLPDVVDLHQDRLRLRHPGEAAPRAGLPQQGDRDPPDRRAGRRAQGAAVLLVGGAPRVRRLPEPGADGAAPAGGPRGQGRGAARSRSRSPCSTTSRSARWWSRTATTSTPSRGGPT